MLPKGHIRQKEQSLTVRPAHQVLGLNIQWVYREITVWQVIQNVYFALGHGTG